MTNGQIFRAAADYIREHGWKKGGTGWVWEMGAAVCLEGAVLAVCQIPSSKVAGWNSADNGQLHPSLDLLAARLQMGIDGPWEFNDRQETAGPVIELLEIAAFDEDLKAAAQSTLPAEPSPIIPTREGVTVG